MIYALLLLSCVIFFELFMFFDIPSNLKSSMSLSKKALAVVKSKSISDDEKELLMRRSSIAILKVTFIFAFKILLIFMVLSSIYFFSIHFLPVSKEMYLSSLYSPVIISVMTGFSIIYGWLRHVYSK